MRFGLTVLSFLPAVKRIFQGGTVDFSRFSYPQVIEEAVSAGFKHVELTLDAIHVLPECLSPEKIGRISELKKSLGFTISAHLPLWAIEPACFNERIRAASVLSCVDAIKSTEILEPEYYVLHATGALAAEFSRLPFPDYNALIDGAMSSIALKSVREIIEKSEVDRKRIALESVEFPLDMTAGMADDLDCSLVLDTGHVLAGYSGEVSLMDALHAFLPRMKGIHLQDGMKRRAPEGTYVVKDHLPLGSGDMKVAEFLDAVVRGGFNGPAVFELTKEEALKSMDLIGRMRPDLLSQRFSA